MTAESSSGHRYPPEVLEFDGAWYLNAYPETGLKGASAPTPRQLRAAERHYRRRGAAEGKNPNPYFSERWYLERYPDVAAAVAEKAFRSGFDHFVTSGYADDFAPTPMRVDSGWYFDTYPDARSGDGTSSPDSSPVDVEGDALRHYLRQGARAGRSPHIAFAESWYLERYPDVRAEVERGRYLCGYQHFLEFGWSEGRQPHPEFGESYYRYVNPDVDAAVLQGVYPSGYFHLVHHGLAESRPWKMERVDYRSAATQIHLCRLDEFLLRGRRLDFSAHRRSTEDVEVSILLILWNRAELTLACLESLARIRDVTFEVVIVDNLSTDRTRDLLERVDGATILFNDANEGYTRAANQAAAAARGRYLLNLNNDAELLPDSLRAAVDRLASTDDAGAVGGRVVTLDGRLQEAGSVVWNHGGTDGYGRGDDPRSGAYLFPRSVDYCSGVFLLTPRALFEEMGGYDLEFTPAYYEESDYCFRLRDRGYQTYYEPGCVIVHFETASLPDSAGRTELLRKNRTHFVERHRKQLESSAYPPDVANFFPASQKTQYRGRILMLDDLVPLERLGGGSPRAREILLALRELGYFVTFFATSPETLDRAHLVDEYPEDGLEFIDHLGRGGFAQFWERRKEHYDAVIVSRAHNFRELLAAGFDPEAESALIVFDAEAVVARRQELRRQLDLAVPVESEISLDEELALARRANAIWAVSEDEGRLLAGDDGVFHVVAHGTRSKPSEATWDERRDILFVGRLDEEWNPNVDALRWYLGEIHPKVRELLAESGRPRLRVVGERGDYELPDAEDVEFLGRVDDLEPLFNAHRVFIAPTRYAAGIPHKVVNSALHGLPVVATSLLARQLGWQHDVELADGGDNQAERFAAQVARVYSDEGAWHTLRSAALRRARKDHGPDALRSALGRAIEPLHSRS